jgi:hypothetical protein
VSIPITADHFCVSADEPAVRLQLLARLLEQLTDTVVTVATAARPDGVTLTVLATSRTTSRGTSTAPRSSTAHRSPTSRCRSSRLTRPPTFTCGDHPLAPQLVSWKVVSPRNMG